MFIAVHRAFLFYHFKFFDKNTNCSTGWALSEACQATHRKDSADVAGMLRYCLATWVVMPGLTPTNDIGCFSHLCLVHLSLTCYNFSRSLDLELKRAFWAFFNSRHLSWLAWVVISLSVSQLIARATCDVFGPVCSNSEKPKRYRNFGHFSSLFGFFQWRQYWLRCRFRLLKTSVFAVCVCFRCLRRYQLYFTGTWRQAE